MSTQSPLPQNDPLLIAFQQLKHTPEYRNAVNWTIKAENENRADGELWFAFAAGWNARNALAATPAAPVREAATVWDTLQIIANMRVYLGTAGKDDDPAFMRDFYAMKLDDAIKYAETALEAK